MTIGLVIDRFIATQKHSSYEGQKLLLVQPLTPEGEEYGGLILTIDGVNAGVGDRVLVSLEGWSAMHVLGQFFTPVDSAVLAVIDSVDLDDGT